MRRSSVTSSLGIRVQPVEARQPTDHDGAFVRMAKGHAGAVMFMGSPTFIRDRRRIVDLAAKHRLPAVYLTREEARAGGLIAYGPDPSDLSHRAAFYVDRILKGANPAELPVEQPTKFELVINLKTAKALGLTIPASMLVQANELIQ